MLIPLLLPSFTILMAVFQYVMNSYGTFAVRMDMPALDLATRKLTRLPYLYRPAPSRE